MTERDSATRPTTGDAKKELLARLLAEAGLAAKATGIPARPAGEATPLSFAQEVLWLLDRATPGLIAYNSSGAIRLRGALDVAALEYALDAVVARHEALRTRLVSRGEHAEQVVDAPARAGLIVEAAASDIEAAAALRRHARKPFDVEKEHLFQPVLVRLSDDDAILLLQTHHIVSDAWSYGVLVAELSALYNARRAGRDAVLAAPPIQFGDYAAWERRELAGERLHERLSYWRDALLPSAPDLVLPTDRPRSTAPAFEGGRAQVMLPASQLQRLKQLANGEGATLYMVLLAAFHTLLHRWSGQDDLVTGSAIAGRTRRETENVIGYFSAALPFRTRFREGESFRSLLARVKTTVLGTLEHQDVPSEALVHELRAKGRPGHTPLFQVVLTMQENQGGVLQLDGLAAEPYEIEAGTTKFELTLLPTERAEGLELLLWYRSDLYEQATADRLLEHLRTLLDGIAANPDADIDRLPMLSAAEERQLAAWNNTARTLGEPATIATLVQRAALRSPSSPAIVAGDVTLSWGELSTRANQLARHLQAKGVGPDVMVGLCMERTADLMVGMMGILAAGGAYVPLVPDQPAARLAQQLAESGASVVVTTAAHRALLPAGLSVVQLDTDRAQLDAHPATAPASATAPENLAYVLFTSGSTGTPKGVAVSNTNLVHYVRAIAATLGVQLDGGGEPLSFATVSTLAADLGHTSVFTALASGGALHVLPHDVLMDASRYQAYMASHQVDVLKITPSHLQALAGPEFKAEHLPRKWLVVGGEACPWALVDRVRASAPCRVLNHYGPTETTVGACTFEPGVTDVATWQPGSVPIGKPLANVTTHVLDARQELLPVGVPGELWIGGAGVARGYLRREELTRERFVEVRGERLYRTGDRVRRLPTGDLEFLGRLDQQVKVRGHRVELGEIESVLVRNQSVRQAALALHSDELVAHVVINSSTPIDDAALVAHLAAELPAYMIPALWVRHDALPLNANGKVDRNALPAPTRQEEAAGHTAPRTDGEQKLAALWAEVLKKDGIGVHDNFFALGGHSLLAIRLLGRIAKTFGRRLSLRALFEHPTSCELCSCAPILHRRWFDGGDGMTSKHRAARRSGSSCSTSSTRPRRSSSRTTFRVRSAFAGPWTSVR